MKPEKKEFSVFAYPKRVGNINTVTDKEFSYQDVQYDGEGWADVARYLPVECDLVILKLKDKKPIAGWVSGNKWYGLRLKDKDRVLFWKRKNNE